MTAAWHTVVGRVRPGNLFCPRAFTYTMLEPTRAAALDRLASFVPNAGRAYRATRNEDRGTGDRSNVSQLAPYIRARLLCEEDVLRAVLARHSFFSAEKFVQEVFWRTYWKGWLESRPAVWTQFRSELDDCYARCERDETLSRAYACAVEGRTEISAFNAWARELVETGYLHNHARMWFASIWIFTLRLPWQLGADFFMRYLLCGDPAANTLSWRWVAGLHTRGKTYRATRDNIRRYTSGRLDGGEHLAARAEAVVDTDAAREVPLDLAPAVCGNGPALLILHDDDAGVESLPLENVDIVTSIGLIAARGRSPRALSADAVAFARGAIDDGLRRAPGAAQATILDASDPLVAADVITERARSFGVKVAVAPFAPVGPVRDALDALEPLLASRNVRLVRAVRAYDALAWPHANRGFFNLRKEIRSILERLEIPIA